MIVPVRLPGLRWKLPNYMNIEDFAQITYSVSKLHSIAQNLDSCMFIRAYTIAKAKVGSIYMYIPKLHVLVHVHVAAVLDNANN